MALLETIEHAVDRIGCNLLHGERVAAAYDVADGTGFLALTDRRLIFQDSAGKRAAVTSVPYGGIQSVSFVAGKSPLGRFVTTSRIAVSTGARVYDCRLRGNHSAKDAHDLILRHIIPD